MISIKDVAKKCGVSVATVSKALNNQKDIAEATKLKIQKVAEEMGYFINPNARSLKTNKTNNIGVLFIDPQPRLNREFYANVLESFKTEAQSNGYDITFIASNPNKKYSYKKHCEYRHFDGVFLMSIGYPNTEMIELVESNIPIVVLDYSFASCSSVISDNFEGMSKLVEYAIKKGHKKIAFIHGEDNSITEKRLSGFYDTMRKHNLEVKDGYVLQARYHSPELAKKELAKLLKLKDKPTCVFFPDDYSAVFAIAGTKGAEKLSFAGYNGIEFTKLVNITTYEQNMDLLGKTAAKKLIDLITNSSSKKEHIVITGKLIEGKTIKKL